MSDMIASVVLSIILAAGIFAHCRWNDRRRTPKSPAGHMLLPLAEPRQERCQHCPVHPLCGKLDEAA